MFPEQHTKVDHTDPPGTLVVLLAAGIRLSDMTHICVSICGVRAYFASVQAHTTY